MNHMMQDATYDSCISWSSRFDGPADSSFLTASINIEHTVSSSKSASCKYKGSTVPSTSLRATQHRYTTHTLRTRPAHAPHTAARDGASLLSVSPVPSWGQRCTSLQRAHSLSENVRFKVTDVSTLSRRLPPWGSSFASCPLHLSTASPPSLGN